MFATKKKLNIESSPDIRYCKTYIKQYHTIIYLGCELEEDLLRESVALKVTKKIIKENQYYTQVFV